MHSCSPSNNVIILFNKLKVILEISVSGKDGITGTGFILSCEITKITDKIYKAMTLQTLEFGPKRTVNVNRWGKREMSPTISLTYCPEEGSRLKLQADK